jgi:hypothetical protein
VSRGNEMRLDKIVRGIVHGNPENISQVNDAKTQNRIEAQAIPFIKTRMYTLIPALEGLSFVSHTRT